MHLLENKKKNNIKSLAEISSAVKNTAGRKQGMLGMAGLEVPHYSHAMIAVT